MAEHKMCPECPFSRTGPGGWLGGYTSAQHLHAVVVGGFDEHGQMYAATRFPCHMKVDWEEQDAAVLDEAVATAPPCVGALSYRNSVCYRPRSAQLRVEQEAVGKLPEAIGSWPELEAHHARELCRRPGKANQSVTG